jgi:GTPase
VGFVRHVPHQLVEAFRSTLEEVTDADLVLHVVDGSHQDPESQIRAVREVFGEIGAADIPELIVVNKIDAADPRMLNRLQRLDPVFVSARTGAGRDELESRLAQLLPRPDVDVEALVPYARGDLVSRVHAEGIVQSTRFESDGTWLSARVSPSLAAELSPYRISDSPGAPEPSPADTSGRPKQS